MKNVIRIVVLLMVLAVSLPALAEESGCRSIPWGEHLAAVGEVEYSHAADGIRYYSVKQVDACILNDLADTHITYGFRKDRLYTVIIEIDKAKHLGEVAGLLIDKYGLPDTKKDGGWDVYRWETDTVLVKLKSQYSSDRIKIGMYYKPLASEAAK